MQTLVWIVRLVIVVILVWFALKNTDVVTVHGLPYQQWQAPLVFLLLIAFVIGVVLGLLAWIPTVVRQRREIGRLRKNQAQLPAVAPEVPAAGIEPPHGI